MMGRWTQEDCVQLATLRLLDPAKAFYNVVIKITYQSGRNTLVGTHLCSVMKFDIDLWHIFCQMM